jgi:hypothetical protein
LERFFCNFHVSTPPIFIYRFLTGGVWCSKEHTHEGKGASPLCAICLKLGILVFFITLFAKCESSSLSFLKTFDWLERRYTQVQGSTP